MCGFFTLVNTKKESVNIEQPLKSLGNRGPDDFGWVSWNGSQVKYSKEFDSVNGELIQAHTRLSIVDISTAGSQPMLSSCDRYSISYNGEIYN